MRIVDRKLHIAHAIALGGIEASTGDRAAQIGGSRTLAERRQGAGGSEENQNCGTESVHLGVIIAGPQCAAAGRAPCCGRLIMNANGARHRITRAMMEMMSIYASVLACAEMIRLRNDQARALA